MTPWPPCPPWTTEVRHTRKPGVTMRTYLTTITTSGGTGAAIEETHIRPDGGDVTVIGPTVTIDDGYHDADAIICVMAYAANLTLSSEAA
jgi:hypothetical protein